MLDRLLATGTGRLDCEYGGGHGVEIDNLDIVLSNYHAL